MFLSHALAHYSWRKKEKPSIYKNNIVYFVMTYRKLSIYVHLQIAYTSLAVATETFEQLKATLPCKHSVLEN